MKVGFRALADDAFAVTTTSVTSATTAVITATLGWSSARASLTITPASSVTLSSLTLNPTSVGGGNNSTGTVTLRAAAPSGGAVVTITKRYVSRDRSFQRYRLGRSNQYEFYGEQATGVFEHQRDHLGQLRWKHQERHPNRNF